MRTINWIETHIDYCFSWTPNSLSVHDFIEEFLNHCLAGFFPQWPHLGCKCLSAVSTVCFWWAVLFTREQSEWERPPQPSSHTAPDWGTLISRSNPRRALEVSKGMARFPHSWWKYSGLWTLYEQGHYSVDSMATLFIWGLQCFHQAELSRSRLKL